MKLGVKYFEKAYLLFDFGLLGASQSLPALDLDSLLLALQFLIVFCFFSMLSCLKQGLLKLLILVFLKFIQLIAHSLLVVGPQHLTF